MAYLRAAISKALDIRHRRKGPVMFTTTSRHVRRRTAVVGCAAGLVMLAGCAAGTDTPPAGAVPTCTTATVAPPAPNPVTPTVRGGLRPV